MKMGGYEMLERCDICGGLIDNEIPDCSTCTCGESGLDFDFDPHGDGPP